MNFLSTPQPSRRRFHSGDSGVCFLPNEEENWSMPRGKHLRGVSGKEQRQYEHIKERAQKSGRYGRRAKEVAARTVMKQHKEHGHAKGR